MEGFVIGMTCKSHGHFHAKKEVAIGAKAMSHRIMWKLSKISISGESVGVVGCGL
jgi:hypothetical protein